MRTVRIAPGEHYHIFNRGVNKSNIFSDSRDWSRLLMLLLYFQSVIPLKNLNRLAKEFVQHSVLHSLDQDAWAKKREVELVAFCLMPNHFHIILKETEEGGVARYMQRVQNAYAKYFNTKYEKSGHLFQGPYRAVHIEDNKQLLHLSAYIHRNPLEINENYRDYKWSSYGEFSDEAKWKDLVKTGIVVEQFANKFEYRNFVETSPAKSLNEVMEVDTTSI